MSVYTIDCNYVKENLACAFLMQEGKESAFIENNTTNAVPILLDKLHSLNLKPEDVKYLIITHVHLDHAGGTAALLRKCPNAIVLAHPKAAPHLMNPTRLVESAKMVYGSEAFLKLYGEIDPVPENRIRTMQDGESITFGSRYLKFIYTRGHANHHFVVYDSLTNGVFTGDSFGIGYPNCQKGKRPFLFPSTTPTDFDASEAKLSIDKIIQTGADKAYLTHFGVWEYMKEGSKQLRKSLDIMENIFLSACEKTIPDEKVESYCLERMDAFFKSESNSRNLDPKTWDYLHLDSEINAMGIAFAAKRKRQKS